MDQIARDKAVDTKQSEEYSFPYHYIPSSDGFPNFSRRWGFSASYIAAIRLAEEWFDSIAPSAPHRHMDFGCGDGGFINTISRKPRNNITLEGIDFDERAISWAKMFTGSPERFCAGDIGDLQHDAYDSGTLIEVFEHIPPAECDSFLHAVAQSLRPNAQLFVTVPSNQKPIEPKHYRHFSLEQLQSAFERFFSVDEIFGFEKHNLITRQILKHANHWRWSIETRYTNEYAISQLSRKHLEVEGCGRIGMMVSKLT